MNLKKKNMASKDKEESKEKKSKDTKASGKKKDSKNTKKSKEVKETKGSNVGQNQTAQEAGHSWGSHNPPISGPGKRTVHVNKQHNRESDSEDSSGNFFSSLKINKNHILSAAGVVAGGALLFRGAKGEWPFSKKIEEIDLNTKQTIKRSREELYAYWRNLENLPNFMSHVKEVEEIDQKRSRWTAEIPGGLGTIEWEAVIDQEQENELLSWKSLPDSEIENSGEVRFEDDPAGKGTIVRTTISYRPPAGKAGDVAAKLLNPAFEKTVKKDLKQFKKHMEEGGEEKQKSTSKGKVLY